MSNGDMTNHPCAGCYYAELDEERHFCGLVGRILARVEWRTCPQKPLSKTEAGEGARAPAEGGAA